MTKRNPMQTLITLAVPAALLLFPVSAQADPPQNSGGQLSQASSQREGGRMEGASRRPQFMQQLGLSPEQRQNIKALMQQGHSQGRALHQQLKTKRQALMQYLKSPDATEAKARTLNADINDLQRELSELRLKTWFGMRAQMTPAQLQKLSQIKGGFGGRDRGGPGGDSHRPRQHPGGMMHPPDQANRSGNSTMSDGPPAPEQSAEGLDPDL